MVKKMMPVKRYNDIEYEGQEDFWCRVWNWCINGDHSNPIKRLYPNMVVSDAKLLIMQVHMKVLAKRVNHEFLFDWDDKL